MSREDMEGQATTAATEEVRRTPETLLGWAKQAAREGAYREEARLETAADWLAEAAPAIAACAGVEDPADLRRLAEIEIAYDAWWVVDWNGTDADLARIYDERTAILKRLRAAGFGTTPETT